MADLRVETAPGDVGLDAARLGRMDRHFERYVEDGRLAGWLIIVARHGRVAHVAMAGRRDREQDQPTEIDTIWRLYSMTKPITAVAALMLYEQGDLELTDPVERFIPSFTQPRIYRAGSSQSPVTVPTREPIRLWHLLTHTSGLTYGFHYAHPVDAMYRQAGFDQGTPDGLDLAGCCDRLAELPLLFEPGAEWNYSMSTDVLGRVVEVASGMGLDDFFRSRIFEPLGMTDTDFSVPSERADRLAALYWAHPTERMVLGVPGGVAVAPPACLSGGGGLHGTASDYHRFASMLRGRGALGDVRLLGPRTVDFMASNHLPANADLADFGRPLFAETPFRGVGFGLGVSVTIDPVAGKALGSVGDFGWGGAASTAFWVDPVEDLSVLFFTQLAPSNTHPIRSQLKALVAQAVVGP